MTEKRLVMQEQLAEARGEWLKDLDDVKDRLLKAIDMTEAMNEYIFSSEDYKTRELVFIIFGIVSVGYMSYKLFNNFINNK